MASLIRQPNSRKAIQFFDLKGKRRTLRLGKISKRAAETVKSNIERLITAKKHNVPLDESVLKWVAQIDDSLREKLISAGLLEATDHATLGEFVDSYIEKRNDVKPSTIVVYKRARRHLIDFFGADKELSAITVADAKSFRRYLGGSRNLADDTVRRMCGISKQFLAEAVDEGVIQVNPFKDRNIPTCTGAGDSKRTFFVSKEIANEVIDGLPTKDWKLMFALARFGGLRCPSEVLNLRWDSIDWESNQIVVKSPKSEHHAGQEQRIIPLFPELIPFLLACKQSSNYDPQGWVITEYRNCNSSYGTLLRKKIEQMGMKPWPKPWQNLRASRETELAEEFPLHVACSWIGNSEVVARKHYLQVTEEHFEKAMQNTVQQSTESQCEESQLENQEIEKSRVLPGIANACDNVQLIIVGDTGLEPVTPCL